MPLVKKTKAKSQVKAKTHGLKPKHRAALIVAHRDDWLDSISMPEAAQNPVLRPEDAQALNQLAITPNPQHMTPVLRHADSHPYRPPQAAPNKKLAHLRQHYIHAGKLPVSPDQEIVQHVMAPHKRPYKHLVEPRPGNLDATNPPTFGRKAK